MKNLIKETRLLLNLTQGELAEKSKVSRTIISFLENGDEVITKSDTMTKIAGALGKPVSEIFFVE